MRSPCIKVVTKGGALRSFDSFGPFSQVYRKADGTINTVKSSLVFTEPDDVALFIRIYCTAPKTNQVWIASADTIEPRDWVFPGGFGFLNILNSYGDNPAALRLKEVVLKCSSKTERPEDDKELNEALDDVKKALVYLMSRIRVVDAPIGTALASNLRLEKCIDFPEIDTFEDLSFEKMVEQITKALADFNENQAQMSEREIPQ